MVLRSRRQIEIALYELERDYAGTVYLYRTTESVVDVTTGQGTRQQIPFKIKAIVLPQKLRRVLLASNPFFRANANFNYGGTSDVEETTIIVRKPPFIVGENDSFIFERERYRVKKVDRLEYDLGFLITATTIKGSTPYAVIELDVLQRFNLISEAKGVK